MLGIGMSLRLFTMMPCPKLGTRAKSGLAQHVVVGRCCLRVKNSMRNMRPCWWEPGFFPGARSDASAWGPGCPGVATGIRICITWCTVGQCPHQALHWGYRDCHIAIICGAGLSEATPLRGHRQWCKLVETRACLSSVCVCVYLAAHTTVHPRQPPPPTRFSLQFQGRCVSEAHANAMHGP